MTRHGRIDILVNNAGIGAEHDPLDVSEEDWDAPGRGEPQGRILHDAVRRPAHARARLRAGGDDQLAGKARGAPASRPSLRHQGWINQLVRSLAIDWAPGGVTVNAVAPTWVYTPGTADRLDDPVFLRGVLDRIPVDARGGRRGRRGRRHLPRVASGRLWSTARSPSVDGGWTAQ